MKGSESAPKPAGNSVFQHNQPLAATAQPGKLRDFTAEAM
jgi:hypothetical protein